MPTNPELIDTGQFHPHAPSLPQEPYHYGTVSHEHVLSQVEKYRQNMRQLGQQVPRPEKKLT
jgi:hypothetical protein